MISKYILFYIVKLTLIDPYISFQIDLLAAARCNMYSHALVAYVSELKSFAQKAASTFQTISKALILKPKYDFCVLKELSQNEGPSEEVPPIEAVDSDQSLFFAVNTNIELS